MSNFDFFQSLLNQLKNYWAILLPLFSSAFFLYKLRAEEVLKTRLLFIKDCYVKYAELLDAVESWSHPVIQTTIEDKDSQFAEKLNELMPKALNTFHSASVLLKPHTVRELNRMFIQIGLIRAEYSNWQMYLKANKSSGEFTKELQSTFENARKNLPSEMRTSLAKLLVDCQLELHGVSTLVSWRLTPFFIVNVQRNHLGGQIGRWYEEDRAIMLKKW